MLVDEDEIEASDWRGICSALACHQDTHWHPVDSLQSLWNQSWLPLAQGWDGRCRGGVINVHQDHIFNLHLKMWWL